MKMKKMLMAALAMLSMTAAAQTEVSNYVPGLTENGITYFLPKTRLHITLTATRKSYAPGEFCHYAERFLHLKNVPTAAYDEWTLDQISITPFGVVNKGQAYTIKLKQKTAAPLVGLAPDGRLLSVNCEAQPIEPLPQPYVVRDSVSRLNPEDYKTEEILSAGNTQKMAELTAGEIYDIRENRALLAKGQADFMPTDGEQLRLMLASLATQEEALLQLFRGTCTTEKHVFTLEFEPQAETAQVLLFRFSKFLGLVENDNLAGEPYYISVKDLKTLPDPAPVDPRAAKKPVEDLRYIVPSSVLVKIFDAKREWISGSFPMAQFGRVEHLGGELFNKRFTTKVTLSPTTGGLLRLDAEQP